MFSTKPAAFLSLDESFGRIQVGQTMRAVLVDPNQNQEIHEHHLAGRSKNSCFMGTELFGKIHTVFLGKKTHRFMSHEQGLGA